MISKKSNALNARRASRIRRISGIVGKVTFDLIFAASIISCGAFIVNDTAKRIEEHRIEADRMSEDIQAQSAPRNLIREAEYHSKPITRYTSMNVPKGDTAFKSYMDWHTITNTRSQQYKLQEKCVTDDNGLRRYGTKYVIALGSYYTSEIGDEFRITLDSGETFRAIVGDFKADKHTDELNQYTPMDGRKCVCEFIVDTKEMPKRAKRMGDVSYIGDFGGNISKIEKVDTSDGGIR